MQLRFMAKWMSMMFLAVTVINCTDDDDDFFFFDDDDNDVVQRVDLLETVEDRDDLSRFRDLLDRADLEDELRDGGPFTVLAPSDDAFDRLPDGALDDLSDEEVLTILNYHLIDGQFTRGQLGGITTSPTVEGVPLNISVRQGTLFINGIVGVETADIQATNGVIHIVDAVILQPSQPFPGDVVQALAAYPVFRNLVMALDAVDLTDALQADDDNNDVENGFTVFAPVNQAFQQANINVEELEELDNNNQENEQVREGIRNLLLNHVVPDFLDANAVIEAEQAESLAGQQLDFVVENQIVLVDRTAQVIWPNIIATNGVIHAIDQVLTPPTEQDPEQPEPPVTGDPVQ